MKLDDIDLNIEYELIDTDNLYFDLSIIILFDETNTLISVLLHCTYVLLCTIDTYTIKKIISYISARIACMMTLRHIHHMIMINNNKEHNTLLRLFLAIYQMALLSYNTPCFFKNSLHFS